MDYVVISPTNEFVNSTEYYLTLKEQGVHALVVQVRLILPISGLEKTRQYSGTAVLILIL